jgi:heterodisulfide reductase subunit C
MSDEENPLHPLKKKAASPVPGSFQGPITNLINQGQIQSLLDFWIDERVGLGLSEKPASAYSSESAVGQTQEIMKELGFDSRLKFDWKAKRLKT